MNTPIAQLVEQLNEKAIFPKEALEQLLTRPTESIPALLELIHDPDQTYASSLENLEDAGLWAMFLLAHFREPKAFPLLIQLLEYPHENFEDFWGDLLLEVGERFLAATYNGDFAVLRALAHNTNVPETACCAAIEAIGLLHFHGHINRETLESEWMQLKERHCTLESTRDIVYITVASGAFDYQIREMLPWLEHDLHQRNPNVFTKKEIQTQFALSPEELQDELKNDPHHDLITDPLDLIQYWWTLCNQQEDPEWEEPEVEEPNHREAPWDATTRAPAAAERNLRSIVGEYGELRQ